MAGSSGESERLWRELFTSPRHPAFQLTRLQARFFKHIGTEPRCRICKVPLSDSGGWFAKMVGKDRSQWNPHLCNSCELWIRKHPGGAEVPMSVLFADVRGSTRIAEELEPREFAALMERFYQVASKVLNASDALVDKPGGDEVRAFYTPVVSGRHARRAILAGLDLLAATGHRDPKGPWVPVGVGVHTGTAFIGTVSGEQSRDVDIAVAGDMVNVTARLSSQASAGEILASETAFEASDLQLDVAESKMISVRGREAPIAVLSIPVE